MSEGRIRLETAQDDFEQLFRNWDTLIIGRQILRSNRLVQGAVNLLDAKVSLLMENSQADVAISSLVPAERKTGQELWTQAKNLRTLALAYRTQHSGHFESHRLIKFVMDGLNQLRVSGYSTQFEGFGNWWEWTIGIPQALLDVCILLRDELPRRQIQNVLDAVEYHIPNPRLNRWSRSSANRIMTSANFVDQLQSLVLASSLRGDRFGTSAHLQAIGGAFEIVEAGDGLRSDGSYIFHERVPYNGTYGCVAFQVIARFALLTHGTMFGRSQDLDLDAFLDKLLDDGILPFFVHGSLLDVVRGRAIQRSSTDADNLEVVAQIFRYACITAGQAKSRARLERCRDIISYYSEARIIEAFSAAGLPGVAMAEAIAELKDMNEIAPRQTSPGHRLYPAMDRAVHCAPAGWQASLAMSSQRIAYYEHGHGENERGYHTGSGMLLIHLPCDAFHYGPGYWQTTDPRQHPGTTVEEKLPIDGAGGPWASLTPPTSWAGGAVYNGRLAALGLDLAGFQSSVTARKSWFFIDDYIVCLGSEITGGETDIHTTVENRIVAGNGARLLLDGSECDVTGGHEQTAVWTHLEGVGGYVFLDQPTALRLSSQPATQARPESNSPNMSGSVRVTIEIKHAAGDPQSRYAYLIYPGVSRSQVRSKAERPTATVLQNDASAQVVAVANMNAILANVYASGEYRWAGLPPVVLSAQCSIILKRDGDTIRFAVSDPTMTTSKLIIGVLGKASDTNETAASAVVDLCDGASVHGTIQLLSAGS